MKSDYFTETEINHFTSDDKLRWWGYGEWVEEPDEVTFYHLGFPCKILRMAVKEPYAKEEHIFGGHLCGYVRIPFEHPYHHKRYGDMEIDCHYGLTFGQVSDGHWIGFDCAHSGDYVPSTEHLKKTNDLFKKLQELFPLPEGFEDFALFNPTYRNINYCMEECKSIVEQLIKLDAEHISSKINNG